MSILVVGSVALDTVETPFGKLRDLLGGSATYFSISASYFTDVHLVGVIGKDFPVKYMKLFKKFGVDTDGLKREDGLTFRWVGKYGYDMNVAETIATHLNVFKNFDPILPERYRSIKHIFLANIDPDLQLNVLKQVQSPEFIASDTMNFWIENKRKALTRLLKKIHLFFINDSEAKELSGESNLLKAAKHILSMGPKMVVIKKGEHGSLFVSKENTFVAPAFPLESVYDPTGAGDSFAGGLLGHLCKCKKIDDKKVRSAIIYGSVMASYAVANFSLTGIKKLNKKLIEKRYKEFKNLTSF